MQAARRGAGSDRRRRAPTNAVASRSSSVTSPAPGDQCSLCQVVTTSVASSRRSSQGRSGITRAPRRRRSARAIGAVTRPLACTIAGSGSRDVERALDRAAARSRAAPGAAACPPAAPRAGAPPRRPSGGRRAAGPERTGALRAAEHVEVGDARQVDAAGARQAVPLPEARVHLHQLEAPVARIEPELGLRDAVEAERREQRERLLDDVLAPARLAHAAGAEAARHLHELAPAEEPERACPRRRCRSRPSRAWRRRPGSPPAAAARSRRRCARPRAAPPASRRRARAGRSGA